MNQDTTPHTLRRQLADTIEDIGHAMGLLRESCNDLDAGNEAGAKMVASDALELTSALETEFSQITAALAKWADS